MTVALHPDTELALALHVDTIAYQGPKVEARIKRGVLCRYCSREASYMIGTGADPKPTPHCTAHAANMALVFARMLEQFAATETAA